MPRKGASPSRRARRLGQRRGDEPSQILDIVTPAGLWDFFSECGEPAAELRVPDEIRIPENLPEMVARYGGAVVGPPLNRPAVALGA